MKILHIVGARPNFMKISPIMEGMKKYPKKLKQILVHTGQHYDDNMSNAFFKDLNLPKPNIYLGVGSGTHAEQTAKIMIEFEKVCINEKPNLVLTVGDVNSTLACSIVVAKLCIPLAHVEAGLRSFDRSMPEEINRIVTDSLSDFLFTSCEDANDNLIKEGIPKDKIYFVGNVMIDTLLKYKTKSKGLGLAKKLLKNNRPYAVITLHRPSNVDDKENLFSIIEALKKISKEIQIIFPVHPRTKKQIETFGLKHYFNSAPINHHSSRDIYLFDPLGYLDFINLMMHSRFVMTDSGGIQEEATVLGIPCLTLRDTTERPITITQGTNVLVGNDTQKIEDEAFKVLNGKGKKGRCPKFWDGKTAERILKELISYLKLSG